MIRLNSIYIKGFKDPEEEKYLEFSPEPISVIYGENGSGKTTLLKILFAILKRDESILRKENVQKVNVKYQVKNKLKELRIIKNKEGELIWRNDLELCDYSSSILFNVHRGIVKQENETLNKSLMDLRKEISGLGAYLTYMEFEINNIEDTSFKSVKQVQQKQETILSRILVDNMLKQFIHTIHKEHLSTDFITINDIEDTIISKYKHGKYEVSEKVRSASFETLSQILEIETTTSENSIPKLSENLIQKIQKNKNFILKAISADKTSFTETIKEYLDTNDSSLIQQRIFRAMLSNMVEKAEEPSPSLKAITRLIDVFNEHLYKSKKLVVQDEEIHIDLGNGKKHNIKNLSSGERNLLSILTLFLLHGQDRNFLMIDEPELSLNMKWQREFLPLLHDINPNAQIIVASHSPSISRKNTRYLTELK